MANIKDVIQKMKDEGHRDSVIQSVVDKYKAQKVGKTSDPVNVEATAGSKDDMASSSENGLSAWQSIKNSFSNAGEQIGDIGEFWFDTKGDGGGAQSSLDIATNAVYSCIFGQDALDDLAS